MTTFIKAKLKNSVDQMDVDKYRVAANITEYHIIYIKINLRQNHEYQAIISGKKCVEKSKINIF